MDIVEEDYNGLQFSVVFENLLAEQFFNVHFLLLKTFDIML